ncbi:MAG: type II secretion system F family protein [Candidatus Peregrinibacteria bacterium]|nr:type II secretion system F family protein [Candidatus Peregrinibacteria bacterium]
MEEYSVDEILSSLGEVEDDKNKQVVYGVTDRSSEPFWVRWNDFFIDRQRVPMKEKAYFFHLLSVMLDAGIPMLNSLRILAEKTTHERFQRVIATMAHHVETGRPLSDAMAKFPMVFEDSEVGVVKSGEAIGRLDKMLSRLSEQLERAYDVHLKLRGALTYPIIVILVLVSATLVVMTMVIPRLKDFFTESGVQLPWLTRTVVAISEFILDYFFPLTAALILFFIIATFYANTRSGRIKFDYWKLKIPFVGDLIQKGLISKFVRLLGVLSASGLSINKALRILGESMGNRLYEMKIREVVVAVEEGGKISKNLAKTPFLFPPTVTQMLSIGESSATLDQASSKLADHYEREIEHSIKNMTTVLEPIVIVLVGIAVGVLALAILGPVFSLSELV